MTVLDDLDRLIIVATQDGLPLASAPYAEVAAQVGTTEADVIARMQRMLEEGVIRRIGVVPNHYALGYRFNGMTVWDVADEHAGELGRAVGALPFVSHCYLRPRHLPHWPYNLFAMVHGRDRETALALTDAIFDVLGPHCRGRQILFSTRILKKTGLRLQAG